MNIYLFGAGALGSLIAMSLNLDKENDRFFIYDDDRVETENIGTSYYWESHIGLYKSQALAEMLWLRSGIEANYLTRRVSKKPPLYENSLVIDAFDNFASRNLLDWTNAPVVHVGLGDRDSGSVLWNEAWTPHEDDEGGEHVCTHLLGSPIIRVTAAQATNSIEVFLATGQKENILLSTTRIFDRWTR